MILRPTPLPTERFTYVPAQNMFVAEASDLPALERVYDDACDEGLTLISQRTGREVVFGVEGVERDRDGDGDVQYWDLRPVCPAEWAAGTVRIFND
jgi:hypothetical protein